MIWIFKYRNKNNIINTNIPLKNAVVSNIGTTSFWTRITPKEKAHNESRYPRKEVSPEHIISTFQDFLPLLLTTSSSIDYHLPSELVP